MIVNKYQGNGGGSGSGSTVSWRQDLSAGTQIARITINGTSQNVYAPEGGGMAEELNYQIVDTLENAVPNTTGIVNDIIFDFTEYTGDPSNLSFEIMNRDMYGDDTIVGLFLNDIYNASFQLLRNWLSPEEGVVYGPDNYGLPFSFTLSNNLPNSITLHLLDGPLSEDYELDAYDGTTASVYSGVVGTFKEGTMVYSQSGSTKYTYKDGWNPEEGNLYIKVNYFNDLYNGTITPVDGMIAYVPGYRNEVEYSGSWAQYQAGRHEGNPITGMTIVKLCFSGWGQEEVIGEIYQSGDTFSDISSNQSLSFITPSTPADNEWHRETIWGPDSQEYYIYYKILIHDSTQGYDSVFFSQLFYEWGQPVEENYYFVVGEGAQIYRTGSETWTVLQDFDFGRHYKYNGTDWNQIAVQKVHDLINQIFDNDLRAYIKTGYESGKDLNYYYYFVYDGYHCDPVSISDNEIQFTYTRMSASGKVTAYRLTYDSEGNLLNSTNTKLSKEPVIIYETDGTTGLLGHNQNSYEGQWQLEDLDMTPYKYIKCYFKASATGDSSVYTTAVVVTVPLDEAAKGPHIYTGSVMTPLPFNRNREYLVSCAVDETKTKFQVIHQNTLWDITASDANNTGRYCYKIEGCYF